MEQKKLDIPEFLQEAPAFTKPDESEKHLNKLIEIVNGMDEVDIQVVCDAIAKKYPILMLAALASEVQVLKNICTDLDTIASFYKTRDINNA